MEQDPFDIAGQEIDQIAQRNKEVLQRQQEIADVLAIIKTAAGRRFIWRMLGIAGVYRSSFSSDLAVMAKAEGRREFGLIILADVSEADPMAYTNMLKEQNK